MFENAIERAILFTRPIHTISRTFQSTMAVPGAATLFFVNDQGWALTCKHVAEQIRNTGPILENYNRFKLQRDQISQDMKLSKGQKKEALRKLEGSFKFHKDITVQIRNLFMNCIEGQFNADIICHDRLDLALIKFFGYTKLLCTSFPSFPRDSLPLKPGKMLCRIGYPFPEFTNFAYNASTDDIEWTANGRQDTPFFPNEGMVTRMLAADIGNGPEEIVGFETSTPGLRGQSGGPVFDTNGLIWGVQAATMHIHLGFDVEAKINSGGSQKSIKDSAFLHVGHVIHTEQIKKFLRSKGVSFRET